MSGEASGKCGVVLLHAFPCDSRMWAPQHEALEVRGRTVVSLDLPGFAGTALPAGDPSLDAVADHVADALVHAGDRVPTAATWNVVGVSLGGYVAMALLRRHPDLVGGLVLCDTKATADASEGRENRLRLADLVEQSPADTERILAHSVLPGLLGATSFAERPEVVARVRIWLGKAAPATVAWYQRAMAARPDSRAVLSSFTSPSAIVWGEEDALSPWSEQEILLQSLPHAQVTRVPGAGHLANVERPDAVSSALAQFVGD